MNCNEPDVEFTTYNGRLWTVNAVDEFIVGRVHGGYDINDILLYITYDNTNLGGIIVAELESFWYDVLEDPNAPRLSNWARRNRGDPSVRKVLNSIICKVPEDLLSARCLKGSNSAFRTVPRSGSSK